MERIIFLSDLWGKKRYDWIDHYVKKCSGKYEVKIYDSCTLGEIDTSNYKETILHQQFKTFGIERAVYNLLVLEKNPDKVIGFSVGGVIAWKAIAAGLNTKTFIGVSATRLRLETQKIPCSTHLFYGEKDLYQPKPDWYSRMEIKPTTIANEKHDMYTKPEIASRILPLILS